MCIRDRDYHIRYRHFGAKKCTHMLKESCVFKNMERRVRKLLRGCDLCQKSKVGNYRQEGELNFIKIEKPFDLVAVDLYGPLLKGRGGVPVSYTHLDVYKRQSLNSAMKKYRVNNCESTCCNGTPIGQFQNYGVNLFNVNYIINESKGHNIRPKDVH